MSAEKPIVLLNDVQLARMARHDSKAAEKMLRRIYPKIFQVVRSTARHCRQVEDIGQMAAVEVMKSLGSFRGQGTLEAWAGQIAFRVAVRSIKRSRNWDQKHVPMLEESTEDIANPEKAATRRQLFESLLEKMEAIPVHRKIPLLLHLAYGYTVGEVSELTGVSPNTVKDRLKTAYSELRLVLDNNPDLRRSMLEEIP